MKIPYGRQHINDEDIKAVSEILRSDFLTQGPNIAEFENKFAEYVGASYAVACSNGTAALHLSAMALDVKPGDRWITSPNTFIASANCIRYCGGEIEFVDIDPTKFILDLDKLQSKLERAPKGTFKGVIPVDFAGYPNNLERLKRIADEYDLKIIEDACHAPGGYFRDSQGLSQFCGNGNFADLAIFSFHPVKHIACGEGGMVTTNNEKLYKRLLNLRTHGIQQDKNLQIENHGGWYHEMQELGYNYRLTNIQAALGISQLDRANEGLKKRNEIAIRYDKAFENNNNIQVPYREQNIFHAFHLYVIQSKNRDSLYTFLREQNIFVQIHYIPVHLQPYYKQFGWKKGDLPNSESYYELCMSLPMYPTLTEEEQQYVITKVLEFYK